MNAIGIDLGGTKIETQVFDQHWQVAARQRVATPTDYQTLVNALVEEISWAEKIASNELPVGVGAAGLINPATGLALTANVCASGQPLPEDLHAALGRPVSYMNDCRALALSETVFGAGRGYRTVLAIVLGTGLGGGIARDGELMLGPSLSGGEFGHIGAPATLLAKHGLTPLPCGCGAVGCFEAYLSGPGMSRIAEVICGYEIAAPEIAARRTSDSCCSKVWAVWRDLAADFLRTLTLTIDPDVIVLAGGLSRINGLIDELVPAARTAQIGDFDIAPIVLAEGGDSSGARGAAFDAFTKFREGS